MTRFIEPVVRYKDMLEQPLFFTVMEFNDLNQLEAVNLTGSTATFTMVREGVTTKKIDAASCVIDPDQNNNKGELQYNWATGDLDTIGNYKGYVTVTDAASRPYTLPEAPIPISVVDLD